jgi:hypothetical protein
MTVHDLRCDACGRLTAGPTAAPASDLALTGVRFVYHPGDTRLRDTRGLLCGPCWERLADWLGGREAGTCSVCGTPVKRVSSLHLRRFDDPSTWQLCRAHAVHVLNSLRTVEPKLAAETFRFPLEP